MWLALASRRRTDISGADEARSQERGPSALSRTTKPSELISAFSAPLPLGRCPSTKGGLSQSTNEIASLRRSACSSKRIQSAKASIHPIGAMLQ
jgi:hypothetical protein